MTKNFKLSITFLILFISVLQSSCGQTAKKDLIVGSWSFEKFEFKGKLVNVPHTEVTRANNSNKGLVMEFTSDNNYSSKQEDGIQGNNSKGTYKLLGEDGIIINGDTAKIIQLDKTYLRLYRNDLSPIVVFRRNF